MPNDDIRAWGRENGFDVADEGRLPPGLRAAYDGRSTTTETAVDADSEEKTPAIVKATPVERLRAVADKVKKPAPRMAARGKAKPRVSVEKVISKAWALAAGLATNFSPAMGATLAMQAPVAGAILEDKVRGTLVDKMLQPVARTVDGGNVALALIGPPLLVQALAMQPQRAPQIVPVLREALRSWIDVAGEKMEQQQAEEKVFADKYGARIDEMINTLLTPIYGQPVIDIVTED